LTRLDKGGKERQEEEKRKKGYGNKIKREKNRCQK